MPAPTKTQIKENMKTMLLRHYHLVSYDKDGNKIEDKTKLMEAMDIMIDDISEGIALTWSTWQAAQLVSALSTIPPNVIIPVVGVPFLP